MEVSLTVVLFCVLVCGVHFTAAEEVVLTHNGNFSSGLVLTCTDGLFSPDSGVSFQRNGMDIQVNGSGTFSYPLTQENEGIFTCTHGDQISEEITLAAEPPLDFPLPPRSHYVLVSVSGNVSTQLECDIGPGAARERYTIEWFQINPSSVTEIAQGINQVNFNLTLTVDVNSNGMVYMCTVTIDHDGTTPTPYDGARITLRTAVKASITEGIQDINTSGHQVNFSCAAVGSEVVIQWTVDGTEYESCPLVGDTIDICFENSYMNNTATITSTLIIPDSSSLGVGSYAVQCTVEQELHPGFETELFQERRIAFLRIEDDGESSTIRRTVFIVAGCCFSGLVLCMLCIVCGFFVSRNWRRVNKLPQLVNYQKQLSEERDRLMRDGSIPEEERQRRLEKLDKKIDKVDHCIGRLASDSGDGTKTVTGVMGQLISMSSSTDDNQEPVQGDREEVAMLCTETLSEPNNQIGTSKSGGTVSMLGVGTTGSPKKLPAEDCLVPPCVKPAATLHCTSQGIEYKDELNGFKLMIPREAIPKGVSLTIDIGVALYGPFQYPEGLRPVSPVFWICVRNWKHHMRFLKTVSITIQHCLKLSSERDIELLGLTFLQGDHEMNSDEKYPFYATESESRFEAKTDHGTLYTYHFCYQCIVCKESEFTTEKANFCLTAAIPHTFAYDKSTYIYFFVCFLLDACLETVCRQLLDMTGNVCQEVIEDFQFSTSPLPAIQIEYPDDLPGGWQIGLQSKAKITLNDVDFWQMSLKQLEVKERNGMYPPRFRVVIDGTRTTEKSKAHICFTGTTPSLVYDIPLYPAFQSSKNSTQPEPLHSPVTGATPVTSVTPTTPVTLKNLMNLVASNIRSRWKDFGIQLDIPPKEFDTYPSHDWRECFTGVFRYWWESASVDYPYTWETVIEILESPTINEKRLAEEIRDVTATHRDPRTL